MSDCVFCKIIKGELPSTKVHDDDDVLAFLDIHPIRPGHTLIIPKKHYTNILETPDAEIVKAMRVVKRVGRAVIDGLGVDGFSVGLNNGREAGQSVFHTHFHIIPRSKDDGLKQWPERKYQEGEMEDVAQEIKEALSK